MLAGPIADDLYELRARTIDRIGAIAGRFAPGADTETIEAYAHAISGAGEQLGRWWIHHPHIPRPRVVDRYVTIAVAALTALAASPS